MSIIVDLALDDRDTVDLRLLDTNTGDVECVHAVDVDPVNLLAIDAAFERRCDVTVPVDESGHIIRVVSEPAPIKPESGPPSPGDIISRISTQENTHKPEVFVYKDPSDPREELSRFTKTPLLHLLCHGSYLTRRPLELTLDDSDTIIGVAKHRSPPLPPS